MGQHTQIPLSKPGLSDVDIEYAVRVLKSGRLECGKTVEMFERLLSTYLKARYVVCVSSGTAALHLGLLALGIRPGDDVIVPAFGCPVVANVVEILGARPVFIDSEFGGFNMDVCRIENNITAQTRAILMVHNFGFPVEISRVRALSAKYDIPFIEDAACALGSSINGVKCGNLGRLAAISFHARKILTTGEGGAVVTDDFDLAEKVRLLRNHGRESGNDSEFLMPGFNNRMTEFQAALGVSQMKRFGTVLKDRIRAASYYNEKLAGLDFLRPHLPEANGVSNYQSYVLRVVEGLGNEIIDHLNRYNIEAGAGNRSIPHTGYYREKYNFGNSHYPESLSAFNSFISLPLYEGITNIDQDRVIEVLRKFAPGGAKSPELRAVESI